MDQAHKVDATLTGVLPLAASGCANTGEKTGEYVDDSWFAAIAKAGTSTMVDEDNSTTSASMPCASATASRSKAANSSASDPSSPICLCGRGGVRSASLRERR